MSKHESNQTGRWLDTTTPKRGWICTSVIDLGDKRETCQMCEIMQIRYVHIMAHDDHTDLRCGCICDGHMSSDLEGAGDRHRQAVNRTKRAKGFRKDFMNAVWRETEKGTRTRVRRWSIQIFKGKYGRWSSVVSRDGESIFSPRWCSNQRDAKIDALSIVQELILSGSAQ